MVLPGPKVQVFILPYRAESKLTPPGRQLATIMQRHVLFAALKYPSIAIEELTAGSARCEFERVEQQVVPRLSPGQVAIFLWGRLFEQGDAIRLQSTVAVRSKGVTDTLSWGLSGSAATKLSATVPTDPVTFAARTIPLWFLGTLESAQSEARRLHRTPDSNSIYWELPQSDEARFGFEVVETKDDWMHIRLLPSRQDGWVPAHALATGSELKGAFPELYFVDGLIGYHQLLVNSTSPASRRRILDGTLASFDQYVQLSAGRAESDARALAAVLKGNAKLRGQANRQPNEPWSRDALVEAQRDYSDAQKLSPTSTTASGFYLACTSALCNRGECPEGADRLHARFLEAVARDPANRELLDNLNVFYGAVERGDLHLALEEKPIAAQRAILERATNQTQREPVEKGSAK